LRLAGEAFAATNADEPAIIPARTP